MTKNSEHPVNANQKQSHSSIQLSQRKEKFIHRFQRISSFKFYVNPTTYHQTRAALKIPFPSQTTRSSLFLMPRAETAAAKASSDGNMCGNWCNKIPYFINQEKYKRIKPIYSNGLKYYPQQTSPQNPKTPQHANYLGLHIYTWFWSQNLSNILFYLRLNQTGYKT